MDRDSYMSIRTYKFLTVAAILLGSASTSFAQEGNTTYQCSDLTAINSAMSLTDITTEITNSTSIPSVVGSVAMNNEQYLGDAISFVSENNPSDLLETMRVIRQCTPSLAASALATISDLLADNSSLLQQIKDDNPELIAQILNGNVDVLPAAGPENQIL